MPLGALLARLFPKAQPPLLLRAKLPSAHGSDYVVADGIVRVEARADHGVSATLNPFSAQGLVLIPWLGGERLDVVLSKGDARGRVLVTLDDVRAGRVIEVSLE